MPRNLHQALAFLLGFWLVLWLSPLRVDYAKAERNAAFAELESNLHEGVNAVRAQRHLIPLKRLPELDAVARAHSLDMARRGYVAHETPEGRNPVNRLQEGGVDGFTLAAENIGATNRPDPNREILHGWLGSPVHRQNLYAPPFNATGIGIARTADGSFIYTQVYLTYPR